MNIAGTEVNVKHRALEIYLAGCKGYCLGCHNPELWDFTVGQAWPKQIGIIQDKIADLKQAGLIRMVWLLGGEPLDQDLMELKNLLADLHRTALPLMLWTHYTSLPDVIRPYLAYAKLGKYVQDGQAYIEPVLQIRLANKEQVVVKLEAEQ